MLKHAGLKEGQKWVRHYSMSNWRSKQRKRAKQKVTFQGKGSSNVEKPTQASGGAWYLAEIKTKVPSIHFHAFAQRLSKRRKHSPDIKLNVRLPLDKSRSWFLHKWPYHQPNTYPLPNALTRVCAHMKASRKQSTLHTHTHSIQVTWGEPAGLEFYRLALADQMQ